MNQDASPMGTLRWPHLQRLAERWLRRWGFALSGLALGLWGVWLSHAEQSEGHAKSVLAVAGLRQQMATLPSVLSAPTAKSLSSVERSMLTSLPDATRQENIWSDVQQVLIQHGLQLLSLRPMPPTVADAHHGGLSSQVMTVQLRGRFEDWARMWAACVWTGPLCALDRISVVATANPDEVQIDAVLRVWMRPLEIAVPEGSAQAGWLTPAPIENTQAVQGRAALFALAHAVALPKAGDAALALAKMDLKPSNVPGTAGAFAQETLPQDPRHWPLDRVRLMGLWRQGTDRQAILSAGPHWTKVSKGQHVTLEGHRVVAITDAGVSLRRAQEPLVGLYWDATTADSPTGNGKK
ncbi:hypothetical protein [Limnohabitans sp.]|jgi:hypothetical protein|uniref:hypothetical protein n=1 Tax=Limnohabitans sp. TaxID=1907725 RepID=UPI0037BF6B02